MELEQAVEECSGLLRFFTEQGIQVIRLGLHAQESLMQDYVAGPYHPAFRELCEGRLYLKQALCQAERFPQGTPLCCGLRPTPSPRWRAQHRCNLEVLRRRNPVKIRTKADVKPLQVVVTAAE